MKAAMSLVLSALLAVMALSAGCKNKVDAMSSCDAQFKYLDDAWEHVRKGLAAEPPQLNPIGAVDSQLLETIERCKSEGRPAELQGKLEDLSKKFNENLMSKVEYTPKRAIMLKKGSTIAEVRDAFAKLDEDYKAMRKAL